MTDHNALTHFSGDDLNDLRQAKRRLESPSLTAELSSLVGQPLEAGFRLIPAHLHEQVQSVAQAALLRSLEISLRTMREPRAQRSRDAMHRWMSAGSGAIGGALGLWALPVELPVSTALILRSIADIARSEGHDLDSLEVRLACLEVFALGGRSSSDNAAESGYWIVRASLGKLLRDTAAGITGQRALSRSTPALVRFVAGIAPRYSAAVSAQVAAKVVPVVSAVAGAGINVLFMNHFQDMARGHFVVRRLEQKYGPEVVRAAYDLVAI
jgi:hypothetical protein